MGKVRREARKKKQKHSLAEERHRDKKKGRLPDLRQIVNFQGLIFERGPIMKTVQMDNKIRDALCIDLVRYKQTAAVARIDELFKMLYIYRDALAEPAESSEGTDEDSDEDQEVQMSWTDWDGMNNMAFQAASWTRRQQKLMPEDESRREQPAGLAETTYDADDADVDMMETEDSAEVAVAEQAMGGLELED